MERQHKYYFSILLIPVLFFLYPPDMKNRNEQGNITNPEPAEEAIPADCYGGQLSFQGGEELVYKLYFNWNFIWIPAGEVVFKVEDRFTYFKVSATGTTYDSYSRIYKINDYFESKIDKETLLPIEFTRDINEGGYTIYNHIVFDQKQARLLSKKGKTRNDLEAKSFEYEDCMHDIMSILYYMRTIDYSNLKKNHAIPVDFYLDHKHYNMHVLYNGVIKKKNIKGLGNYDVLEVAPVITNTSLFREDELTRVYASNDANRVPMLIESPLTIGSVKAVLISYKGLKTQLGSR